MKSTCTYPIIKIINSIPGKLIVLIASSMLLFLQAYSQTKSIYGNGADSLMALIRADQADTTKVVHLNSLGWMLMYINPDTSILLGNQALELANEIYNSPSASGNSKTKKRIQRAIGNSYNNLGTYYWVIGEYDTSLINHLRALEIRIKLNDKQGISTSYGNIGIVFYSQADYPKALEYYFKALEISIELENLKDISRHLGNIGAVYIEEGQYSTALDYYLKELDVDQRLHNKAAIASDLGNIGVIYHYLKKSGKALQYYRKAILIFEEIHNEHSVGLNFGNIGAVYDEMGDYNNALEYYSKALEIAESLGEKRSIAFMLGDIGRVYLKEKEYSKGEEYSLRALKISKEIGELSLVKDHNQILSDIYAQTRRFELAYKYHVDYTIFKDSLFNDEKSKDLGRLETRHELEMEEMERIKEEENNLRVKTRERNRKNLLEYSGITIILFMIGFIIVFLGLKKVSMPVAKGVTFFAFLLLFEFLVVLLDPYINKFSGGEPAYSLIMNAAIAACIFPLHGFLEKKLIKQLTGADKK